MRTSALILISVCLLVSLVGVRADALQESTRPSLHLLAQAPGDTGGPPAIGQAGPGARGGRLRDILQQLGLSQQQWQQVRDLRAASQGKMTALRQAIQTVSQEPQTAQTAARLAKARQDLRAARAQMWQRLAAILTPDQRARLQQLRPQSRM